jgi:hypothetical protein
MEKDPSSKQKTENDFAFRLFQIETMPSSYNEGLVFTVLAEDHKRAEELVLEWIKCYGNDNDEIETIRAVVSRDVRAIISAGTKLLTG